MGTVVWFMDFYCFKIGPWGWRTWGHGLKKIKCLCGVFIHCCKIIIPSITMSLEPQNSPLVFVKAELPTSKSLTQPSDQTAVDINKVYNISFHSYQEY